jgi:hypothetical protein
MGNTPTKCVANVPTADQRRVMWVWSLLGAGIGVVIAAILITIGSYGDPSDRVAVRAFTLVCVVPTGLVLEAASCDIDWWRFHALLSWPIQGLLLGIVAGKLACLRRWKAMTCTLVVVACQLVVDLAALVIIHLLSGP